MHKSAKGICFNRSSLLHTGQSLTLTPARLSIDPDFPDEKKFNYTWWCRVVSPEEDAQEYKDVDPDGFPIFKVFFLVYNPLSMLNEMVFADLLSRCYITLVRCSEANNCVYVLKLSLRTV